MRKKAKDIRTFKISKFDAAAFLDNERTIAEYLSAAAAEKEPEVFILALGNVARARGMGKVARRAGLGRESLYKALAPGARPRYETVRKLLDAVGVKMVVET